jgi:hypothetical protein
MIALTVYYGAQAVLEHYRPQLLAEITDAVGCPVSYSRATLRLTPSLEVVLHDVAVMGTDLGFEVQAPYFSAEVKLSALMKRHLDFDRLTLRSPTIVLIMGSKAPPSPQPLQATSPQPISPSGVTIQPEVTRPLPGIDAIAIDSGRIKKRSATGDESLVLEDLHIASQVVSQGANLSVSPSQASFVIPLQLKNEKRLPFTASLQGLQYTASPRSIVISGAKLSTGTSSTSLSGSINLETASTSGTIHGDSVSIGVIQDILGTKGLSGTANIEASLQVDEQSTQVHGTIALLNAQVVASTGETYGVSNLAGPLDVERVQGKGFAVQSKNLSVQGFSYKDPNVSLNHVNGSISALSGTITENGIANFTLSVQGTGLDLTSGPFTIKRISSVSAPLVVSIPANGYSVSGPVRATGVDMSFHGRPFEAASGAVDMLVSRDVLRFVTNGVQTHSNKIPIALSGTVQVTDADYILSNVVGKIADGELAASVDIQRAPRQDVQVEVLARALDIASLRAISLGELKGPFSGRVEHLSAKATARKNDLLNSAHGEGVIEISDGTIARANFDKRVVGIIRSIPVVGSAMTFSSPSPDSTTYEVQGGMLKHISADFTIGAGKLYSKNIKGRGRFSNIEASGDVHLNGTLDLVASAIYLEQNLRALAGPITPLGSLFGTIGKIEIPIFIKGTIDTPQISADLSRLQDISLPGRAISPLVRGLESIVDGVSGK